MNFLKNYKIHFLVWFIFIVYESIIAGLLSGRFGTFGDYAIHYAINIYLFYLNAHWLLPKALKNRKQAFLKLPIYLVLLIISYVLFVFCVNSMLIRFTNILEISHLELNKAFWFRTIWRAYYFIGFSTGYYFLITFIREKNRANELETEKLTSIIENQKIQGELIKTQNAFLKAQINPHFLFNTLTFMYNHTRKVSPKVAETILSLSDMMRYALKNEIMEDKALLLEEIEQVENLIRLHQLKLDEKLHIKLDYPENLENIRIIPLVLLTLAENMFKHGTLTLPDKPAQITIRIQDECLLIETSNLINRVNHTVSHHVGMDNIQKRLELTYRQNAAFSYGADHRNYFNVRIEIKNIPS